MKGILIRDVLILYKKYLKITTYVVLTLGILATIIFGFSINSLLSLILPAGIGTLATNLFVEDEKDNWLRFIKTLPISSEKIVLARFLVFNGLVILSTLYILSLNVLSYLIHEDQKLIYYIIFSICGFAFSIFNNFLLMPACYKFGIKGANNVSIIILIVLGLFSVSIQKINFWYFINIYKSIPHYIILVMVVLIYIIMGFISIKLSTHLYNNKDKV